MIIDAHTHIFPDELATHAMEVLVGNSGMPPFTDATVTGLLTSMHGAGVDSSIIAPIATKPSQVSGINHWAAELARQNNDIISFGTLHPLHKDWNNDINYLVANRFPGIKLHPDYQEFFVDDPSLIPIYRAIADAGLILLFHAGVDVGLPPPVHCTPDRLARVLDAVPELTVIAAHMGGYKCWDDVERYLVGRNLFFDTSYSLADLGAEHMMDLIKAHGVERILFGTDSPWTSQSAEVTNIRALPLSDDEKAAILGGNAERLLGMCE